KMTPPQEVEVKRQAAREVINILEEISALLARPSLPQHQLSLCVSLIENGVNPEALANVIKALRTQYPVPLDLEEESEG
ncbi:mitotic-spindle organizing protein 1, partial [Patellaria atrata CBS 101060]